MNLPGIAVSLYDVISVSKYILTSLYNVYVYEFLVSVKLNNADKECGCLCIMYM